MDAVAASSGAWRACTSEGARRSRVDSCRGVRSVKRGSGNRGRGRGAVARLKASCACTRARVPGDRELLAQRAAPVEEDACTRDRAVSQSKEEKAKRYELIWSQRLDRKRTVEMK